jgi:hypothetical protein
VALEAELHASEVVSVGVRPTDAFEAYQPTSVLSGQELAVKSEASLGELLKTEPGVAPGPPTGSTGRRSAGRSRG